MYLQKLSLINFKNYEQAEIEFTQKINCFVGNNAVGKTNLVDAIYYLSFCKSFFNPIDSQNITHHKDFFVIQGQYIKDDKTENVYCGLKRNQKKIFKRNNKEYPRLADHIGLIPLVMVSPSDINLIMEGSEERRKFIDSVISQFDKQYLEYLINYNKALEQRNSLLKQISKGDNSSFEEMLDIWNEQLIKYGNEIHARRIDFINQLIPIFQNYYSHIAARNEKINLIYQSQLTGNDFNTLLKSNFHKDKILEYTTVGIHKDDLLFNLDDYSIKKVGSQGQQKTYLVALKLAQFDFFKKINNYKPILLLDDVFDKLDSLRVTQIIKLVAENNFGQIFITDKSKEHLVEILKDIDIESFVFYIENGIISDKLSLEI